MSDDYDYELVQHRLTQLQNARELKDEGAISFLLRTSLTRNFAGMSNPKLYMKSHTGTKRLIEDFNEEIVQHLKIMSSGISDISNYVALKPKLDFFRTLRQSLGNTALLLSGGGALGVYHIGVIEAIVEAGMLPRIIAGSSSGSIIAAMICTRRDDEIHDLISLKGVNYNFMEPRLEHHTLLNDLMRKCRRWFQTGVVFDPEHIKRVLQENLGDMTFLEAYSKTKRLLNIAVSSSTSYEMPCLLNYLTAPNVLIWSAVQASCALPMFYTPVHIMAKNHDGDTVPWQADTRWIDGSVENDIPMKRLSEVFNVNNFIVCQVNPHIYPFVALSPKEHLFGGLYEKCFTLFMSEIKYRLQQIHSTGYFRKTSYYLLNIIQQPYQGDVTIVPKLAMRDYISMFSDLERESVERAMVRGQHATWPKISMIKSLGMIEMALDEIMVALAEKERSLAGRLASTESLLEAIQDTANVLSCTPLAHATIDELEGVENVEDLLLDTSTLPSFADSVIFQQENVEKPPEYSKPRMRTRSMTFTPPLNNSHPSSLD